MIKVVRGKRFIDEIQFGKLKQIHDLNIRNAFAEYGKDVKGKLFETITTGSRTGRVYRFRGAEHIASAPGEPPANRGGRLAGSFKYKTRQIELIIYSGLNYAFFLEEGTVRMKPRSYFEKTNVENSYKLYRMLNDLRA